MCEKKRVGSDYMPIGTVDCNVGFVCVLEIEKCKQTDLDGRSDHNYITMNLRGPLPGSTTIFKFDSKKAKWVADKLKVILEKTSKKAKIPEGYMTTIGPFHFYAQGMPEYKKWKFYFQSGIGDFRYATMEVTRKEIEDMVIALEES